MNSVAFAPHELGLVVAAASSDGSLSVLTHQPDGSWQTEKVLCPALVRTAMRRTEGCRRQRHGYTGSLFVAPQNIMGLRRY